VAKAAIEKNTPALQILEKETVMCYNWSIFCTVLKDTSKIHGKICNVLMERDGEIIRRDRVRYEVVLYTVKGDRNILLTINGRNTAWIGRILRMNCFVNTILN